MLIEKALVLPSTSLPLRRPEKKLCCSQARVLAHRKVSHRLQASKTEGFAHLIQKNPLLGLVTLILKDYGLENPFLNKLCKFEVCFS